MSSLKIFIIHEKYLVSPSLAGEHPDCVGGGVGGAVHGAAGRHPPPRHPGHRGQAGQGHLDQAQDGGGRPQAEEGHQVRLGGEGEVTRAEWSVLSHSPENNLNKIQFTEVLLLAPGVRSGNKRSNLLATSASVKNIFWKL